MASFIDGKVKNAVAKEKRWTDAEVRWTAANHNLEDEDHEDDPSEDDDASVFQPEPTKTFSYQFGNPFFTDVASDSIVDTTSSPQTTTLRIDNELVPKMINIDLRGYPETDDTIYMSTGLTLWRSSQLLCEYMLQASSGDGGTGGLHRLLGRNTKDIVGDLTATSPPLSSMGEASVNVTAVKKTTKSRRILELGAGLGLNGILAYLLIKYHYRKQLAGAEITTCMENSNSLGCNIQQNTVIMTDGDSNALAVLRDNVKCLAEEDSNTNDDQRVTVPTLRVQQLLWGTKYAEDFLKVELNGFSSVGNASGSISKGKDAQNVLFDIILASDAIYVMENVRPLLESVQVLLAKPHGEFWFSYCCRRQVSVQIEDVLKVAEEMGFVHEQVLAKKDDDDDDDDQGVDNRLLAFVFRWKSCCE